MTTKGNSMGFQFLTMDHVYVGPIFGSYSPGIPYSIIHGHVGPFLPNY